MWPGPEAGSRKVEQGVGVGDGEGPSAGAGPGDPVCGPAPALGDDAQVEAGAVVGDEQEGHARFVQAHADAVAGHAWLGDLELGFADAVPVADAHLVVHAARRR